MRADDSLPWDRLPAVHEGIDADLSDWSVSPDVDDLVRRADLVVYAEVVSEIKPDVAETQQRESADHGLGAAHYILSPVAFAKGEAEVRPGARPGSQPGGIQVQQYATWFDGERDRPDWNVPLEAGQRYLLFLRYVPDSDLPGVVYPHIHLEIDGNLYWNGAKGWRDNGPSDPQIGRDESVPLMAFWQMPVDEALAMVRDVVRSQATQ